MPFTTQVGEDILQCILEGTPMPDYTDWDVSLHTDDPGQDGANEVTGGTYTRQLPPFGAVSGKSATSNADMEFTLMPACTITHLGLWGYITDTWYFIWGGTLGSSKVVGAGDTVKIPTGDLDVDLT